MTEKIPYALGGVALAPGAAQIVELPAQVWRARLTGLLFDVNKSFLLPAAVAHVRGLKRLSDEHGGLHVLVTGHTDRSGDEAYNLRLSQERAASVAAFLRADVEAWMKWYGADQPAEKRWDTLEDQHMLSALSDSAGPYYTGAIDGVEGSGTRAATRRFQAGKGLPDTGERDADTRRALVTGYVNQPKTTLPPEVEVKSHGCGQSHNAAPNAPGARVDANRRVDVFLFDGAIDPPPVPTCPSGGCAEYPEWLAAAAKEVDLGGPPEAKDGEGVEWTPCTHVPAPTFKGKKLGAGPTASDPIIINGVEFPTAGQTDGLLSPIVVMNFKNKAWPPNIKPSSGGTYPSQAALPGDMAEVKNIVLHETGGFGNGCMSTYDVHFFVAEDGTIFQCTDTARSHAHCSITFIHAHSVAIEFANAPFDDAGKWLGTVPDQTKLEVHAGSLGDLKPAALRNRLVSHWLGDQSPKYQMIVPPIAQLEKLVWLVKFLASQPLGTDPKKPAVPLVWRHVWPVAGFGPLQSLGASIFGPSYFVPMMQNKPSGAQPPGFAATPGSYAAHQQEAGILSHSILWPESSKGLYHGDGGFQAIYTWMRLGPGGTLTPAGAYAAAQDLASRVTVAKVPAQLVGQASTLADGPHGAGATTVLPLWPAGAGPFALP